MTARILMDTHADALEEDEALKVTVSVPHPNITPIATLNGPDGEVELVGRGQIEAAIAALQKALLS